MKANLGMEYLLRRLMLIKWQGLFFVLEERAIGYTPWGKGSQSLKQYMIDRKIDMPFRDMAAFG